MRLLDLFYPYPEVADLSHLKVAVQPPRMRAITGLTVDPIQGSLLLVDSSTATEKLFRIYEFSPDGRPIGLIQISRQKGLSPFGIAPEPVSGGFWLTDQASNGLICFDRRGHVLSKMDLTVLGIQQPGPLASSFDGSRLFVTDSSVNRVIQMDPSGHLISSFKLTPYDDACLRGITYAEQSGHLLLAYIPKIAEHSGHVGKFGIFETTLQGHITQRIFTDELGFCALDIAVDPNSQILFAASREYVLPQTPGDHSHVFVVDLENAAYTEPSPHPKVVWHFLRQNNLHAGLGTNKDQGETHRWTDIPVPVCIDGLIDMSPTEVQSIFVEWSTCAKEKIRFVYVPSPPETGIIFRQGTLAFCAGGPIPQGAITVCVCDRGHLTSHPHGMDHRTAQRNVARHEIGHAIGFTGHSPRFRIDTMNSVAGYSEQISPEEAAFVEILYSHPPNTTEAIIRNSIHRFFQGEK